jgi:serine protease Do
MRARFAFVALSVLSAAAGAQSQGGDLMIVHGHADESSPPGYLGIVFTAPLQRTVTANGVMIRHLAYPVVESVEPGSPAAHAGISAGDTIVAYDSADVLNRDIAMSQLLKPGNRVVVRIRRNGVTRDISVRVAPRPASFAETSTQFWTYRRPTVPPVPPAPMAPLAPGAAMPDIRLMLPLESSAIGVAGAEVVRANADLCAALGASHGILVLDVAEGSPAETAGLKAGDVIVDAGRTPMTAPIALMQVVEESATREVPLTIVRRRREQKLALKW